MMEAPPPPAVITAHIYVDGEAYMPSEEEITAKCIENCENFDHYDVMIGSPNVVHIVVWFKEAYPYITVACYFRDLKYWEGEIKCGDMIDAGNVWYGEAKPCE